MALIQCRECTKEISSNSKACPHCGSPTPRPIGIIGYLVIFIVGWSVFRCNFPEKRATSEPPISAEQAAINAEISRIKEKRFDRVVFVLASIKAATRDPNSLSWVSVLANDDASVVCVTYRARNGFGGMNVEHVVGSALGISTSASAWNKSCANRDMHDMISARHGVP